MSQFVGARKTPRNGLTFDRVPTTRGRVWGGPVLLYSIAEYASILDSVYEMARDMADANGIGYIQAVDESCEAEGWTVMPSHKLKIVTQLEKQ